MDEVMELTTVYYLKLLISLFVCFGQLLPVSVQVMSRYVILRTFTTDDGAKVYDINQNNLADLTGDIWIYDRNNDAHAELAIVFQTNPSVAYVYDDADADGQVSYTTDNDRVEISEPHWRAKVLHRGTSWYLENGKPDWNIDLTIDSGFQLVDNDVLFQLSDQAETTQLNHETKIDGVPELEIRYWDDNYDGVPDYELNNIDLAGPYDALIVNKNPKLYIEPVHRFPLIDTLFSIDWSRARIEKISHLIPTRLSESGYFFYFNQPTKPGQVTFALENPFAFYDLQDDKDGFPELRIRGVTEDNDSTREGLSIYNEIRYSWAQEGNTSQYRMYLAGQVINTEVISYPTYPISHVPYEDLPNFSLEHQWQSASFAEYEESPNVGRTFVEGIYENLLFTPQLRSVLLDKEKIILPQYLPVYKNLREEYNFTTYNRKPRVYFSPIDQRLHMVGAQQGIIILSSNSESTGTNSFDFSDKELQRGDLDIRESVVYSDTDHDMYTDTWMHIVNKQSVAQLSFRLGTAILVTNGRIAIKQLPDTFRPAMWEATPPSTTENWRWFGARLEASYKTRRQLNDLEGMFTDLPGSLLSLSDTQLLGLSQQPKWLVAHINVLKDTSFSNSEVVSNVQQPVLKGEYVLIYKGDKLFLDKMESALLVINNLKQTILLNEDDASIIQFDIENKSNWDVDSVDLEIEEYLEGELTVLQSQVITIPSKDQLTIHLPWMPTSAGKRTIAIRAKYVPYAGADEIIVQDQIEVEPHKQQQSVIDLNMSISQMAGLGIIGAILILFLSIWVVLFVNTARENS